MSNKLQDDERKFNINTVILKKKNCIQTKTKGIYNSLQGFTVSRFLSHIHKMLDDPAGTATVIHPKI